MTASNLIFKRQKWHEAKTLLKIGNIIEIHDIGYDKNTIKEENNEGY